MRKSYRNKEGEKLYPVCAWEDNQHKLYNAHDRATLMCYDTDWSDKAQAELKRVEDALNAFGKHIIGGIVYATYKDSLVIKDIVAAYDARH